MALGFKLEEFEAPKEQEQELGFTDNVKDVLAAPLRGIEGAAQSIYNLADFAAMDLLPDYDNRFLGKSETIAGGLVEGITQFVVPFGGIAKAGAVAAKAGKLGRVGKSFVGPKGKLNWKGVLAAESATDFVAFDAQEQRLSNLIETFPQLSNPVTEFLAAKDDDGEIEGRLKNSLEGMGLTGLASGFIVGLKAMRANRSGKDGAKILRENETAFAKRMFGESASYNAYSPSLKAVDQLKDEPIFLHQVTDKLNKATGGMRGISEELKWMGVDDAETLKDLADPSEIVKGKITKKGLRDVIERNQLKLSIVEREPKELYRVLATQKGGESYREFTVDINPQVEAQSKRFLSQRERMQELETYTTHYEDAAMAEGNFNLAHFRTTERYDDDGVLTLYIEELQSDFLQSLSKSRRKAPDDPVLKERAALEKSYVGSMMRSVIQMAASEGYGRVSWAKGQQVSELYDTTIERVVLNKKNADGSYEVALTRGGKTSTQNPKTKDELIAMVGKKAADDINSWKEGESRDNYTVKVNASPFISQYDSQMPKAIDRFAKAFKTKKGLKTVEREGVGETITQPESIVKIVGAEDLFDYASVAEGLEKFAGERFVVKSKATGREVDPLEAFREALEASAVNIRDFSGDDVEFDLDDVYTLAQQLKDYEDFSGTNSADQVYKKLFTRFEFNQGKVSASPIEAHSIDINEAMVESVSGGISAWGVRTKQMQQLGEEIKDPELRAAMGIDDANSFSNLKALQIEQTEGPLQTASDRETTVGFALERLHANGSSPEVRKLAEALRKLVGDDVEVNETSIQAYFSKDAAGAYNATTNQIEMYTNRTGIGEGADPKQVFGEGTLLHEIIHSTVVTKIPPEISAARTNLTGAKYLSKVDDVIADANTSEPARNLLKAYRKAVDNIPRENADILNYFNDPDTYGDKFGKPVEDWYGFTNVDEFVAEAMSNPKFQNFLKGIDSDKQKSLFDEILQVLKDFLGLDAKGTLLEDTVLAYSDLVSKHKARFDPINYYPDHKMRMFPTRSSRAFLQRTEQKRKKTISDLADEMELDTSEVGRGGKVALTGVRNSLDEVETTEDLGDLLAIAEAKVEQDLAASPKLKPENLEAGGIAQAVNRFSELTGVDKNLIDSEVKAAGKDANELRRIAARMYTVESMATAQADNVWTLAGEIAKKGTAITEADKAQLVGSLKKMMHLVAAGSNLRRGFGQGLRSTQFKRTRLSLSDIEIRNKEIVNEFMANNTSGSFEALLNRILLAGDTDDLINRTLGISKQARASDPRGFMEKAQNWYVNSLLSGPRTMVKNGVGNMVAQALLQTEAAVGGVFVDKAITKQVLKEMATFESFREGMDFFLRAYKMGDQLLDTGRSPLENTSKTQRPMMFENAAPEQSMRQAFNWFGENVVNIPTKMLLSMDEVFKQSMFRQNAKIELTLKGMKLGIKDPDKLAEYVAEGLDVVMVNGERAFGNSGVIKYAHDAVSKMDAEAVKNGGTRMAPSERGRKIQEIIDAETAKRGEKLKSLEEGGLGFENLEEIDNIAARSLEHARYGTFTNDAGKAAELAQAIVQTVPFLKFIFPFVRTPINILKFSFDRAFFAAPELSRNVMARMPDIPMIKQTQQRLRQQLESRNPLERARAIGKMTTSSMINATLLYTIMANRDFITGGGPKDRNQLKTLEQAGWQRYSFKFGNKYASFSGMDPIGTHFGVLVDIVEQLDDADELNSTLAEQVFAAATISMTRNLTDKSYLAGLQLLSDALSDPENKMEKMINNLAGGFVPNILYQGQSLGGDTTTREVRSIGDAILKKLPMGNDRLDPKRNLLGEPIIAEQIPFVGPFNPSRISTRDGDPVFEELAQLEHGFTNPRPKLDRLIDLDEYVNDKGQTAHDRRLELTGTIRVRGRTLRQELTRLINSGKYRRLSPLSEGGFKSPRVDLINRVLGKYRTAALNKMMDEFPEIRGKYQQIRKAKRLAKRGASEDVLTNLLSF